MGKVLDRLGRIMNARCLLPLLVLLAELALAGACGQKAPWTERTGTAAGNMQQAALLMTAYGCSSCHTVPGIRGADGVIGPPLDFWGSRRYIAGALQNEPANLTRWLQDPQSIEPGTVMPFMRVSADDAQAIAEYLYTLRRASSGRVTVRGLGGDTVLQHAHPSGTGEHAPPVHMH